MSRQVDSGASRSEPGSGVGAGLELVLFDWAAQRFAIQSAQVRALRPLGTAESPSIGELLGLEAGAQARPQRLLEVGSALASRAFRVQEPVRTRCFAASALHPLPPLLAASAHHPALRALVCEQDGTRTRVIPILDAAHLLE